MAYLLANIVDIYIIIKQLRHYDIGITSRKYAYLIYEYKNGSNDEIAQILNKV
ncbi:hypothetical protein B808_530 [Fructilactobacillus florum 8D]|uniref:Integrase n=1 Tax=Fructilactobacillus florum 8D TaxID=1221538 RepID=W9EEP5_9LACO|nr:hypothetical protein B807_769 [Fructilactobacillus florum 2F]ETO40552.1 hypothetical protein B808_530 [Fructilactobacillus florum 8D]